ncbi:unnamed protein product [Linum tenue]|uniref:F-box domain-containing protein n=1 Tax=Linum tenue TaxID=586396 RepID=A0AAV0N4X0_9ROSI|nr:unnamed protein product [Linum tenue]
MTSRHLRRIAAAGDLLHPATKRRRTCSRKGDPPSAISKLGDDLFVELLVRLPDARSAFRCKSVCKRWSSLISSPSFRRRFVSHHQNQGDDDSDYEPPLLPSDDAQSILSFIPVPEEIRWRFSVFSSFSDLVLCGFEALTTVESYPELARLFFVCNPFTKQWVALPLAPERPGAVSISAKSLVCQPRSSNDGSDEYRFRVVRVSGAMDSAKVDLFCSESGEWMEDVVAIDRSSRMIAGNVLSWWEGKLFWRTQDFEQLAAWDPFSPDAPPTSIASVPLRSSSEVWTLQGTLFMVFASSHFRPGRSGGYLLTVWRWGEEEGRGPQNWRILCGENLDVMLRSSREEFPDLEMIDVLALHPSNPEIVFLECRCPQVRRSLVFSCNLKAKELKFFADEVRGSRWKVFQPRFTCWPTPIPSYEKLQGVYDGSYSCFLQSNNNESATPPVTGKFTCTSMSLAGF